jgi:dTDP-4-dehydrorhamnose 3,5-epimerase
MEVITTDLPGLLVLRPCVHRDGRGFFLESWNQRTFDQAVGRRVDFVQDNRSHSARGVLRGLHYQVAPASQGKLVSVLNGSAFDVAVDLRRDSPAFGKSFTFELRSEEQSMVWIPEGLAHGFLVTSDSADVAYKATEFYSPEHERCLRWDDPDLAILWPLRPGEPTLSSKDASAPLFRDLSL